MINLENLWYAILWILLWLIVWYSMWSIIRHHKLQNERKMSVKRSKSVILWEVYEKIIPFLPNFPYHPRDMVFVWKWVDYIIFHGLANGNLQEIIFLEVKSGSSKLNKNERVIRDKILAKNIQYKEYRV